MAVTATTQLERYVVTEEMLAHREGADPALLDLPTGNPAQCCCATARKR